MPLHKLLAFAVFALTYFAVATGKLPPFRLDRAGAALAGAVAMIVIGAVSRQQALDAIDFSTLALLLGMMIVVAYLRLSGAFTRVARLVLNRARSGFGLLMLTVAGAGVLAAFFINDVVCIALAPILIEAARTLKAQPQPFLLALATASNIGSTATITGNPQNMIVAGYAHLTYGGFVVRLAPVAVAGLVIDYAIIAYIYRDQLRQIRRTSTSGALRAPRAPRLLMWRSAVIALGALVGFILGYPTYLVALTAGAVALFTRRIKPERVYHLIDWTLLLMFAGLFVVVAGFETTGLQNQAVNLVGAQNLRNPAVLASVMTVLSNLVSNVPAVMLIQPLYHSIENQNSAVIIASASTLAGNLTVLGSIANLIVLEEARKHHVVINFWEYLRVGLPLTIITLAIGIAMISAGL
ncbi:MAG TPA: anion transporter [Candidatus Binataceae bacterium]|nr:anion transporter [Candidatus Binataceae bacterium]